MKRPRQEEQHRILDPSGKMHHSGFGERPPGGYIGSIVQRNPSEGIMILTPPEGEWNSGCFVVMLSNGSVDLKKTITVLN